jgi:Right handed beta helix region
MGGRPTRESGIRARTSWEETMSAVIVRRSRALVALALVAVSPLATAAAQRTFVASTGNDADPCSIAQPCRGFARAITQTNAGGEVIVVDSAGYGPVSIAKSITLAAPSGVYAGVSVTSGSGITVSGSGIAVTLRGLTLNGQGGSNGIVFVQGAKLNIENCEITGFATDGIAVTAPGSIVTIKSTAARDNAGSGVSISATGSIQVNLDEVRLVNNALNGLYATGPVRATIASSVVEGNGIGLHADAANIFITSIIASRNTIIRNTTGVQANATMALGVVMLDANLIGLNGTAVSVDFESSGYTFGNNSFASNTSDGTTLLQISVK